MAKLKTLFTLLLRVRKWATISPIRGYVYQVEPVRFTIYNCMLQKAEIKKYIFKKD